jgi:DNA excision repair protein ERCC-4
MRRPPEVPTIVVDTRDPVETAWTFGDLPTVRAKLDAGDYSYVGGESSVAIERKTLSDWIATLTYGRDRFERELDRLASYRHAVIVVEAHLDEVLRGDYRSSVPPKSLLGSTASIESRWGIGTQFLGTREHAMTWARTWLLKCWKNDRHPLRAVVRGNRFHSHLRRRAVHVARMGAGV